MVDRFNPPPGWPPAPAGWQPGPGWRPDPAWPPAPAGWQFWVPVHDGAEGLTRSTAGRAGTRPPPALATSDARTPPVDAAAASRVMTPTWPAARPGGRTAGHRPQPLTPAGWLAAEPEPKIDDRAEAPDPRPDPPASGSPPSASEGTDPIGFRPAVARSVIPRPVRPAWPTKASTTSPHGGRVVPQMLPLRSTGHTLGSTRPPTPSERPMVPVFEAGTTGNRADPEPAVGAPADHPTAWLDLKPQQKPEPQQEPGRESRATEEALSFTALVAPPAGRSRTGGHQAHLVGWSAAGLIGLTLLSVAAGALAAPTLVGKDRSPTTPAVRSTPAARATSSAATRSSLVSSADEAIAGARTGTALAALGDLRVQDAAASTGYTFSRFATGWVDSDDNGCDQRADVMRRDLARAIIATDGCEVATGVLHDPWSGRSVTHHQGGHDVDVTQVVSPADAWVTGARRWTSDRRLRFVMDPLNLQAVVAGTEVSGDAAAWLPQVVGYRCTFVARQIAVKNRYTLWITTDERTAMAAVLTGCPEQQLPPAA